jgi:stress-induced-phosphoprotein 1
MGDLANAVNFYQKAQTEHRTPEVLAKLRAAEKNKITKDRESYINPEEAEKARELGNAKFKEADWPAAVEAYSEMIKRAPEDPRGYSNRAACFIKLLEFPSAVQDCDEAIKRDRILHHARVQQVYRYVHRGLGERQGRQECARDPTTRAEGAAGAVLGTRGRD